MKKSMLALLLVALLSGALLAACGSADKPIEVKEVVLAKSLGQNMEPVNPSTTFLPTEPISVSVKLNGRPKKGTVEAQFYYGDQFVAGNTVDVASANSGVLFSVGENTFAGFTLSHDQAYPVTDQFYVKILIDGKEFGKYPFAIVAQ